MNIKYTIDSDSGLMKLRFKKNILNPLGDNKDIFEKYILPMLAMNDKFVLTGSLSLKLLGFEPVDKVGDFDFGLTDTFTEEDYMSIKNFFDLHDSRHGYNWEEQSVKDIKFDPKAHMWQLFKSWNEEVNEELGRSLQFKLDIFNDEMLRKRDIITVYYDDFPVRLVHPSITLSYRMRYALDTRSSTTYKYWVKMKEFMDNAKSYYNHMKAIQKMNMRVHEHNANIEGDKKKVEYLRHLIKTREVNTDNFFEKVFNETIDPFTIMIEKEQEQFKQNLTNAK